MLKPLEQFICDKCKEVIDNPNDGYVEFLSNQENQNDKKILTRSGFKIVHHGKEKRCQYFTSDKRKKTLPLRDFLDENKNQSILLSFLDEGEYVASEALEVRIKDLREFTELARRTSIPYYEEARIYFEQAKSNGDFYGVDGYTAYWVTRLKEIIEKFSNQC